MRLFFINDSTVIFPLIASARTRYICTTTMKSREQPEKTETEPFIHDHSTIHQSHKKTMVCSSADKLINAIKEGDLTEACHLLDQGVDVNSKDTDGRTALMWASMFGYSEIVTELLEKNSEIDLQNNSGNTALHWASGKGHADVVEILVAKKATADIQNKGGNTPLIWASHNGHLEVVTALLKNNPSIHIQNKNGDTAINIASDHGNFEIVKALQPKRQRLIL